MIEIFLEFAMGIFVGVNLTLTSINLIDIYKKNKEMSKIEKFINVELQEKEHDF